MNSWFTIHFHVVSLFFASFSSLPSFSAVVISFYFFMHNVYSIPSSFPLRHVIINANGQFKWIVMRTLTDSNCKLWLVNECVRYWDMTNRLSEDTGFTLLLNYLRLNWTSKFTTRNLWRETNLDEKVKKIDNILKNEMIFEVGKRIKY